MYMGTEMPLKGGYKLIRQKFLSINFSIIDTKIHVAYMKIHVLLFESLKVAVWGMGLLFVTVHHPQIGTNINLHFDKNETPTLSGS